MFDVIALGESLIDFTPAGSNAQGMALFARNPGGAPANVLAMCAKLGGATAFIGKVGADDFGDFLQQKMQEAGINTQALIQTAEARTTLAFVQLNAQGDRSFSFYRKQGADVLLRAEEVPQEMLGQCGVFHCGSVSLTNEPCRSATKFALQTAKSAGALISYDPNYRPLLWDSLNEAKREMCTLLPLADVIKVSEEEMELLTGCADLATGAQRLALHGALLVLVTLGPKGAFYHTAIGSGHVATYDVQTVDTTGAGDAFLGALLWQLRGRSRAQLETIGATEWEQILAFANAAGSLTTTRKGAIPAMPTQEEIYACMANTARLL